MRRRLALLALATTTLVVLAVLIPLGAAVRTIARDRAVRDGELQGQALIPVLASTGERDVVEAALARVRALGRAQISVMLPDGTALGSAFDRDIARGVAAGDVAMTVSGPFNGVEVYTPVTNSQGRRAVIAVRIARAELTKGVTTAWRVLVALGLALVGVAMVVADRLARSIVRPIDALARTTDRLQRGDRDARVEPDGPPEVQAVARTLNTLADRIETFRQAERESVADLSHRLRTPIAGLRFEAESLRDAQERDRVLTGVDDLTRAVDRLIADARRVIPSSAAHCDAVAVVEERVAFWRALADEEGRHLALSVCRGDPPLDPGGGAGSGVGHVGPAATTAPFAAAAAGEAAVFVPVADDDLGAVLDVLLGNVFAHTPAGTPAAVSVEVTSGGQVRLTVQDDGPGFARLNTVERGTSGAGSTGLGLDIARQLADRAGGRLEISNRHPTGSAVKIELPRYPGELSSLPAAP